MMMPTTRSKSVGVENAANLKEVETSATFGSSEEVVNHALIVERDAADVQERREGLDKGKGKRPAAEAPKASVDEATSNHQRLLGSSRRYQISFIILLNTMIFLTERCKKDMSLWAMMTTWKGCPRTFEEEGLMNTVNLK
uniref:Uncharacterized protein n=1 Tax=Ananas comosus var. bracteatus TaxID=296719 RepID=A0A6V7QM64_ANACO|nr:unnamed protein product [Ananas comosus var. bracteatus]